MAKQHIFFILFFLVILTSNIFSQRFQFAGIIGVNTSQIDGDSLFGYYKSGLHLGGRISYANRKSFDLSIEMLYSQRGASRSFFKNKPEDIIHADYIEIPLVINLRDWYNTEDDFYKVRAELGLSFARLVHVTSAKYEAVHFNKTDLSWFLGCGVRFTRQVGVAVRYTSSFVNMYNDPKGLLDRFKSYFLTFRAEYFF